MWGAIRRVKIECWVARGGVREQDPPEQQLPRWLTVDQIRKMQRMRRERVVEAMLSGSLPFEQRGRIRYARLTDVLAWEKTRLGEDKGHPLAGLVHPDLADWA